MQKYRPSEWWVPDSLSEKVVVWVECKYENKPEAWQFLSER